MEITKPEIVTSDRLRLLTLQGTDRQFLFISYYNLCVRKPKQTSLPLFRRKCINKTLLGLFRRKCINT